MFRKDNLVAKPEFKYVEELTANLFDDFYEMYDVSFYTLREINSATKRDGIADLKTEEKNTAKTKKDTPATWDANLCFCVSEYRQKAKNFIDTVEKLCEGAFADKSEIRRLQEEVIRKNSEQIREFSSTVQHEIKSYCNIVKKNCDK